MFLIVLLFSSVTFASIEARVFTLSYPWGGDSYEEIAYFIESISTSAGISVTLDKRARPNDFEIIVETRGTPVTGSVRELQFINGGEYYDEHDGRVLRTFLEKIGAAEIRVVGRDNIIHRDSITAAWTIPDVVVNNDDSEKERDLEEEIDELKRITLDLMSRIELLEAN